MEQTYSGHRRRRDIWRLYSGCFFIEDKVFNDLKVNRDSKDMEQTNIKYNNYENKTTSFSDACFAAHGWGY